MPIAINSFAVACFLLMTAGWPVLVRSGRVLECIVEYQEEFHATLQKSRFTVNDETNGQAINDGVEPAPSRW